MLDLKWVVYEGDFDFMVLLVDLSFLFFLHTQVYILSSFLVKISVQNEI